MHTSGFPSLSVHNLEAEEAVVGCLLLDAAKIPQAITFFGVAGSAAFYDSKTRTVYQTVCDLGPAADILTVGNALRMAGKMDDLGETYLPRVAGVPPTSANWEYYAGIVTRHYRTRLVATAALRSLQQTGDDPDAILSDLLAGVKTAQALRNDGRPLVETIKAVIPSVLAELDCGKDLKVGELLGIGTGLSVIDRNTGGVRRGELWSVLAPTGGGKSALVTGILRNAVKRGPVLVCSNEMNPAMYVMRLISSVGKVNALRLRIPRELTDDDWRGIARAAGTLGDSPICFAKGVRTVAQVQAAVDAASDLYGGPPALVGVDWFQNFRDRRRTDSQVQEYEAIAKDLSSLAGDYDIPLLVAAQIDKESARNKIADAMSIRTATSLQHEASVSLSVFFEDHEEDKPFRNGHITITKNRNGPMNVTQPILFRGPFVDFVERDTHHQDAGQLVAVGDGA